MTRRPDTYTHGHAEAVLRSHRWRTAENSAAYLLPHLIPAARVLDVGCGPGTITVDLARLVPEGSVLGMDRSAEVVKQARTAADAAGSTNTTFAVGDVYSLDHADDSFDVVHAHQVLQHLTDPVAALREMARVCRPEGLIAVRDSDYSGFTWWPNMPELDDWLTLYQAVARGNDAEPDAGRRLKSWALEAGLEVVTATASVWCFATTEDVQWWGEMWAERIMVSDLARQGIERNLATRADLERLSRGWLRWTRATDAWFLIPHGELLCRPGPSG